MMMQSELSQSSWPLYSLKNSNTDEVEFYGLDWDEFSSSFGTTGDISNTSLIPHPSTLFPCEFAQSPASDGNMEVTFPAEGFFMDLEEFEPYFNSESEGSFPYQEMSSEGENGWSPGPSIKSTGTSMDSESILTLPCEDMLLDKQLNLLHLLRAYGEAMEKGQRELAAVIMRCVSQKVSPAGEVLERIAFYFSQDSGKQSCYLREESCKNFVAAFKAFYQIFPHGRFAHFAANSAILEAMPTDAETIHIVDFDIGEGIQWPPVIEALAQQQRRLRLTAIKWEKEDCDAVMWSFEQTKRRLVDHAKCFGLKLKVEEIGITELVDEIKKANKRDGRRKWLAFNCMVGLPHMGRMRGRKSVQEFFRVAKELMSDSIPCKATSKRGIITFADGGFGERASSCSGFGSFFDENLMHYRALLESIESNFPIYLAEARIASECLFVSPYISSQAWLQRWMEISEGNNNLQVTGSEEWRVSKESLEEAREMVKQTQSFYEVKCGGNQMILEWKGTPLLRVSAWRH